MTWPDGGSTPFRGEKATNWEGAYRVPTLIRWPGNIKPGTIVNDMAAHEDFLPTFLAAAGEPDIVAKTLKGYKAGKTNFKVHLDGYNLVPFLKGEVKESPRKGFIYWSDDGDVFALRVGRWKSVFIEQNHEGIDIWMRDYEKLRFPKIFDLLADPFERGDKSLLYNEWLVHHVYMNYGANALVGQWLQSFKEFPPRQKPASFNLDEVMRKLSEPTPGNK
jgi:arylsulfatase